MAIFPFSNAYVINKDAVAGSSFKAGMILMSNSSGNVVPADSQQLALKSVSYKQSVIIGVAAGDSNITGNTIIVPDYIGSNYLDSNNKFISYNDKEYLSIRRQLLDYADETVNDYYNINYSPIPKRKGIGIYNLVGETFATDQFSPVLHGDYGFDSLDTITFSPGDLLTIGGGVNAGKLVKVNLNSLGPSVVVVGIVEKYNSLTGLLYFRYLNDYYEFPNIIIMFVDAANPVSYPRSGTTWYDLSGNNRNMTLVNGVTFDSKNYGVLKTDGIDDRIELADFDLRVNDHTILGASRYSGASRGRIFSSYSNNWLLGHWNNQNPAYYAEGWVVGPGSANNNNWQLISAVENRSSDNWKMYLNGSLIGDNGGGTDGPQGLSFGWYRLNLSEFSTAEIGFFIVYNRVLSASEVVSEYSRYKSRYGL